MLKPHFEQFILEVTGAEDFLNIQSIQKLWSGYGNIFRISLLGAGLTSVIVKHISLCMPEDGHPRGWNSNISHQRKLRSYQIERNWYQKWSNNCTDSCRVPNCLAVTEFNNEILIVLEDLDASGFSLRKDHVTLEEIKTVIKWLASFHACFMHQHPENLWQQGTYWHLATRPDELQALSDLPLKKVAAKIDSILNNCQFQTFVHGDAKLANFCFSKSTSSVAAVDFQYVGGGCGMKDLAYFIGSCLQEEDCRKLETPLLDYYFSCLKQSLTKSHPEIDSLNVCAEWRDLYAYAWTDFHRFIKGWSPGHWKINTYSETLSRQIIKQLS